MAYSAKLEIKAERLKAQLDRGARRLYGNAEKVLHTHEPTFEGLMKEYAPVGDRPNPEGHFRDEIFAEVRPNKSGPVLWGGIRGRAYPVFLEFGTSEMEKQPWLRPAIADTGTIIKAETRSSVKRVRRVQVRKLKPKPIPL